MLFMVETMVNVQGMLFRVSLEERLVYFHYSSLLQFNEFDRFSLEVLQYIVTIQHPYIRGYMHPDDFFSVVELFSKHCGLCEAVFAMKQDILRESKIQLFDVKVFKMAKKASTLACFLYNLYSKHRIEGDAPHSLILEVEKKIMSKVSRAKLDSFYGYLSYKWMEYHDWYDSPNLVIKECLTN